MNSLWNGSCKPFGKATPGQSTCGRPKMVLMRGLPGSGKSTLAAKMAAEHGGTVFSADDYFVGKDGVYRYDRSQIRQAHQDAQRRIAAALSAGCRYAVVDNTHITRRDMDEYLQIAVRFGAVVELVEPTTQWAWNIDECSRRNVHLVPRDIIHSMASRYNVMTSAEAQAAVDAIRRLNGNARRTA